MSNTTSVPRAILVTGDIVTDHYLYEGQTQRPGSTIRVGTVDRTRPGGAAMLCDLLSAMSPVLEPKLGLMLTQDRWGANGYSLMQLHEFAKKEKLRVWRVTKALGYELPSLITDIATADPIALDGEYDVVAIDDAGLGFRRWPSRELWPRFLLDANRPLPSWLVIKLSSPAAAGDLWHTLVSGQSQDIIPHAVRDPRELLARTIAVIAVNDLRLEPIHVAKPLSWERTALDLARALEHSPLLEPLRKLRCLVVSFDSDGALIAEFPETPDKGPPHFKLVFDPARLERDFNDSIPGDVFGFQTCLVSAVIRHLPPALTIGKPFQEALQRGVTAGLCGMRKLLMEGHGPEDSKNPGFPFTAVAEEIAASKHTWAYGAAEVAANCSQSWTIISRCSNLENAPLWGLARRVALKGVRELTETPYQEFGKLFSIERTEIESLRSLRRLFLDYRGDKNAKRPLSIAVFGPPGAGKSFGVKQLAKAVFDDDDPPLEFNLSQFEEPHELHGLFHQVRDRVLLGKLPLVFWDEFDSKDLMWLQYLLAPMQDGTFQEGQITHPLGKCIFVFAGGTRERFEDFGEFIPPSNHLDRSAPGSHYSPNETAVTLAAAPLSPHLKTPEQEFRDHFRALKGPDFKSRLSGYLNVFGPNRRSSEDITYPVRRALLLRVQLGVKPKEPLVIDSGLLTGLLEIGVYKHGARSIEKIAEQLRQASRNGEFHRSDLPSRTQLDLHVNAAEFLDLVEKCS